MHLEALSLRDFRNYAELDLTLAPGVTTLVGANGQGKTNAIESVVYVATGSSHRVSGDAPLVRAGCSVAHVAARVQADERSTRLDVQIKATGRNGYSVNGSGVQGMRNIAGIVKAVVFAPEDVALIKGDPAGRRRFLDDVLCQLSPRFAGVKADYDKVLRQRNTALRTGQDAHVVGVWDDQLVGLGSDVIVARRYMCERLLPHVEEAYATLVGANHDVALTYETTRDVGQATERSAIAEGLRRALARTADGERARGVTLVGPHRDDAFVGLAGLPARGYASHGESWSLALALRVGSLALLRDEGMGSRAEREPIMILDDVFAELDATRRDRLAKIAAGVSQTIVTAAVVADIPDTLGGNRVVIEAGKIVG